SLLELHSLESDGTLQVKSMFSRGFYRVWESLFQQAVDRVAMTSNVLAVGSAVAGYCKTAVLAFKAPSRELVSELHQCLAGAQVSLTLEILAPISPCFAPLSLALCPSDEPLGYMEI
ncbi:unnamed protein product, partial [Pleuronectes platessa]